MFRKTIVFSLLLFAFAASAFAGQPAPARYDFPMFTNFENLWDRFGAPAGNRLYHENREQLGIPPDGVQGQLDSVEAMFQKAVELADANFDLVKDNGIIWTQWRQDFVRRVTGGFLSAYSGDDEARRWVYTRMDVFINKLYNEASPEEVLGKIPQAFEQNVLAVMSERGISHPAFGAYALFHNPNHTMRSREYATTAVPNLQFFEMYRRAVGDELAYKALGEAILNSAIENVLWSPIQGKEDSSWFVEYVMGYGFGSVSNEDYAAFISAIKARARASKVFFTVRKQLQYAAIVDEWLNGKDGGEPLFKEYEDMVVQ